MDEALRLTEVTVERGRRTVVDRVSLRTRYGTVLAVLGPNGAGKTTLLDSIACLREFRGEIALEGASLRDLPRLERATRLAYVPQTTLLDSPMRVADVVAQGRFAHRDPLRGLASGDHDAIARALEATDVGQLSERPFTALSHGERRRVLIARALATGARALLLDEPSASLDIGHAIGLFALLRRLADSGHHLVVVLHQLDEALRCADEALLLADGACVAHGPTREVVAAAPVRRVYGVDLIPAGGLGYRRAVGTK